MTPVTKRNYEASCHKLAMIGIGLALGSYEPIDLLSLPATHLLLIEGFRNLTAVVVEGTGCDVKWNTVDASPTQS